MQYIGLNDLREKFLSFFESKSHYRLESFPLLPINDNSLLLINSGMAPMKNYFLGKEVPPAKRVTTCQKCIRTPDIDNVGKTSRHGTFFEMLGNFSFGDYFKREACAWAWEFVTDELKIPVDRLYVSVYKDDDEAAKIWVDEIGVPAERIVRLGKEDNFWEIGSGPCGPCSEIYFDRGEKYGCGKPDCAPGCDCDRYVEFWNLVFSQFDSDGNGNYTPMEHPNIDTGMGLERLACIMQGVDNLFEVDTIQNILKHAAKIANTEYKKNEKDDISLRVITDHIRSTTFMLCDGIKPSNEGRGYVLKRLLRRAARHGRLLGINRPFLYELCKTVIKENTLAYPELVSKQDYIVKSIKNEEETFLRTIDKGMEMLEAQMSSCKNGMIDGAVAFKLYDTYGFPIDLTLDIVSEKGIGVDVAGFEKLMQQQKERARSARQDSNIIGWREDVLDHLEGKNSNFVGYTETEADTEIAAIVKDGKTTYKVNAGDKVTVVLVDTPFYAESGGQVADTGKIIGSNGEIEIIDCKKDSVNHFMHFGKVISGSISVGDKVSAQIDTKRRNAIKRNHTSAHLLQAALREILGDHVHQAGSLVEPDRLRYDFTHFSAMTDKQIEQTEQLVNDVILQGIPVENYETDIENTKDFTALFGEKYGKRVRVCKVSDFSKELCGGTHIDNTAKIGLFKIISEGSVSSGVRRIEAVTGLGVLNLINDYKQSVLKTASVLKINNTADIENKCRSIMDENKQLKNELAQINEKIAANKVNEIIDKARIVNGTKVITSHFNGYDSKQLRQLGDTIKSNLDKFVAVLTSDSQSKGNILVVCSQNVIDLGVHAGKLVSELAAIASGKGGGRPDSAMAGVPDISKFDEILNRANEMLDNIL
jgi:alanine--tRNA ligase